MPTLNPSQTLALYEYLHAPFSYAFDLARPTPDSIARINAELGIVIPESMVTFARGCGMYGRWFAGLGDDYKHHHHILNVNRLFKERCEDGFIPDWLVIINHGHDGDCDCLDTRHYDAATGEFPIVYWSYEDGATFAPCAAGRDFPDYLEDYLLSRVDRERKDRKREAEKIIFGA